jgi:hypothetical protein
VASTENLVLPQRQLLIIELLETFTIDRFRHTLITHHRSNAEYFSNEAIQVVVKVFGRI